MVIRTASAALLAGSLTCLACAGCGDSTSPLSADQATYGGNTGAPTFEDRTVELTIEQEVGQPGVKYMDPEFDPDTFQVGFYDGLNEVYLGQVDPATGHFVDHNYQHVSHAAPIVVTLNGPEWGKSKAGVGLYFTGVGPDKRCHNFRYRDGQVVQLDAGDQGIVANYPSRNPTDPASLVMGVVLSDLEKGNARWAIFSEDRPDLVRYFDMAVIGKGSRYVPGRHQATTNMRDENGVVQVGIYDFDQDRTEQVTFDSDDKDSAVAFTAPELGDELLLFAKVGGGVGLRVYRQTHGSWQPYQDIKAPSGTRFSNSQVFNYKGETFFSVNTEEDDSDNSDILLVSLTTAQSIKVSGPGTMKRFDPETLVSADHVLIYYYDLDSGRLFLSDLVLR